MRAFNWDRLIRQVIKPLLFAALLLPVTLLVVGIVQSDLGADPQKYLVHKTGEWALNCLWLTLAVTPLRRWAGISQLLLLRRMLGLFCFFYACLHVLAYATLYMQLDWALLMEDLSERPYIIVGFLAFLGLWPLALTSTRTQMRRLGRRWVRLHRLIYPVAVLVAVHFTWQTKSDLNQPVFYGVLLVLLLAVRIYWSWPVRQSSTGPSRQVPAAEK
jgi:methionine sulfoxide reductase heme-binding subunit